MTEHKHLIPLTGGGAELASLLTAGNRTEKLILRLQDLFTETAFQKTYQLQNLDGCPECKTSAKCKVLSAEDIARLAVEHSGSVCLCSSCRMPLAMYEKNVARQHRER